MRCVECSATFERRSMRGTPPSFCEACKKERRKKYDKHASRKYRQTDEYKEKYRAYMLKKNYGLTVEQHDAMFEEQGGRCAICRSDDPGWKKGWHVDHCHEGGHVRGILCQKCNLMVGMAGDRPEVLRAAASYLEDAVGWVAPNIADIIWKENDGSRPTAKR